MSSVAERLNEIMPCKGDVKKTFRQIGQNVPARTAKFIAGEALRVINDWNNFERSDEHVMLFDNTKQIMKPILAIFLIRFLIFQNFFI